ncbi:MAG: nicotinamide riboside transporter PnuC [Bacteroidota bacterium]|nr:nicotinamide riboside transporter PnuC [Bacteroidota bacterium]
MGIFDQYMSYSKIDIILELTAVVFSIISVVYSKKNNIKVYPYGIVSVLIYLYLFYKWELLGELLIYIYYLMMSVYGWVLWGNNKKGNYLKISKLNKKDVVGAVAVLTMSLLLVITVYYKTDKLKEWWATVDIVTSSIFFVGMFLLAKRKLEHWLVLLAGNILCVPMFYHKGYAFTAILYLMYTIIAIVGYLEWKKVYKTELTE